ncbi:MAG: LCP family protein [Bacillota bacterium]|nr:LCP family protein [Bacillota bacterium]
MNIKSENTNNKSSNKILKKLAYILISILILIVFINIAYNERINVLVMGLESTRTDTIIFLSIDTGSNRVDAVSIPRDTYYPTEGKDGLGQKKINAVYGFTDIGGPEGLLRAVSNLLSTKIDYYVLVDYEGVEAVVDLIGGVEVDVPFRMKYDDPYAKPPLHIDFESGVQVINGAESLEYLRFRKSNDGSFGGGDVSRIERQQDFLKSAAKSAVGPKLPFIIARGLSYVESDIPFYKGGLVGISMIGTNSEKINFHTLPMDYSGYGNDGLSYFFHGEEKTSLLMDEIIN